MYSRYDIYFKSNIKKKVFLATIISTLKKPTKFKYKNTTPGEQKGEAIVFSVQQPLNLILYRSNIYIYISRYCIDLYNIKARGQCYVKAIEVEPS